MKRGPVFKQYVHPAVFFLETFYSISEGQLYAVPFYLAVDKGSHIGVKRIHQLSRTLDDGDVHAQFPEIFRKFKADKSAACQDGGFWIFFGDVFLDAEGVFHSSQCKHILNADAGETWLGRLCPGRKNEPVIALAEGFAGFQIPDRDAFSLRMDGGDFMTYFHIYPKTRKKIFRSLKGELFRIFYDAANIIREAAVCIGNISGTFKYDDFCMFIQPADSGCRSGSACHSAYNYYFHDGILPFRNFCKLRITGLGKKVCDKVTFQMSCFLRTEWGFQVVFDLILFLCCFRIYFTEILKISRSEQEADVCRNVF